MRLRTEAGEAQEAYEFAIDNGFSKEALDSAIVQTLSTDALAESLAYIFRMEDFKEWAKRQDARENAMDDEDDEDYGY